jgi:hypothetical protein
VFGNFIFDVFDVDGWWINMMMKLLGLDTLLEALWRNFQFPVCPRGKSQIRASQIE